jgi:hypothetical protein
MFQHQTIAELAAVAGLAPAVAAPTPEPATGPIPLTPIQRWYFEQESPEPHYYNMAVILQARPEVDPEVLGRALHEVVAHHEALHLRFTCENGGWQQRVGEVDGSARWMGLPCFPGSTFLVFPWQSSRPSWKPRP